jgi:hypothetical protein
MDRTDSSRARVIQSATKQSAGSATPMRIELRRKRRIRTLGQHCGHVSVWTGKCSATARQDDIKREWPQVCATPVLPVQVGTLCLPRSDEIVHHFPRTGGCQHSARGSYELNDWSSRKLACGGRRIGQSQRAFAHFRRLVSVQCRSRQQKRISVAWLSTNRGTRWRTRCRGTWRWSLDGSRSCCRDAQARRRGSIHPRRFSQPEPNAECDSHCQSSNEHPRCIAMHHQSVPRRTAELTLTAPKSFRNPFNSSPGSDRSIKISAVRKLRPDRPSERRSDEGIHFVTDVEKTTRDRREYGSDRIVGATGSCGVGRPSRLQTRHLLDGGSTERGNQGGLA